VKEVGRGGARGEGRGAKRVGAVCISVMRALSVFPLSLSASGGWA